MAKHTLKSGSILLVNFAGFKDSCKLQRALAKQLKENNIDIDLNDVKSIKKLFESNVTSAMINAIKNIAISIATDENIQEQIFSCLRRCTYNGVKITEETFDNEKAVEDYYEIMYHCIVTNLSPFLKNHVTQLQVTSEEETEQNTQK